IAPLARTFVLKFSSDSPAGSPVATNTGDRIMDPRDSCDIVLSRAFQRRFRRKKTTPIRGSYIDLKKRQLTNSTFLRFLHESGFFAQIAGLLLQPARFCLPL